MTDLNEASWREKQVQRGKKQGKIMLHGLIEAQRKIMLHMLIEAQVPQVKCHHGL